ncbi:MAG TPA: AmpG family muropeptide MFS transporter, partial [Candidatus Saccharimonadia bacterium]|nr:AmpG family muropeptide MFS transporter [Candidatus Saccharimonadia bacterium]
KFLWSPVMDGYVPLGLGRRRSWVLITQVALVGTIAALGLTQPSQAPWTVAAVAVLVTFCSASQDIVLDAYRRELLPDNELGLGSSLYINGYRLAMLVAGAGALLLADQMPWRYVYYTMAAVMALGLVITLCAPESASDVRTPESLRQAVIEPFLDYFRREDPWMILAFILLYKIGDTMASAMTTPFILELGFSKTEYATIGKSFGLFATLTGGFVGGAILFRLGIFRSLWIFGVLQAVSTLGFAVLTRTGTSLSALATVVAFENLTSGMGTSAYAAYMASLTNRRFTATQYALLTSLMGLPRVLASAPTGYIGKAIGWQGFFVLCALIALPGILLLLRVAPWRAEALPASRLNLEVD